MSDEPELIKVVIEAVRADCTAILNLCAEAATFHAEKSDLGVRGSLRHAAERARLIQDCINDFLRLEKGET